VYLRFDHAYDFEPGFDGGLVARSSNSGVNWYNTSSLVWDNGYPRTLLSGQLSGFWAFSGLSYGYKSSRANLTPLAGRTVRFRFDLSTDSSEGSFGWLIDNVRIYTCDAPGATPTVTPPRTPTQAPSATPTPTPIFPTVTPIPPVRDAFSNPASGWPNSDYTNYTYSYTDGEYRVLVKTANYATWAWNGASTATSFRAEIDARAAGHTNGASGIAFAIDSGNLYAFQVRDGTFRLRRLSSTTQLWTVLIGETASPYILTGNQTNRLKVVRNGAAITLYANGHQLGQSSDSAFGTGYVGVVSSAYADNFEARYDNFLLVFDPNDTWTTGALGWEGVSADSASGVGSGQEPVR
jgi:hypothetical protein